MKKKMKYLFYFTIRQNLNFIHILKNGTIFENLLHLLLNKIKQLKKSQTLLLSFYYFYGTKINLLYNEMNFHFYVTRISLTNVYFYSQHDS